ncbi:acyl-CoA dehydrogenase family protein [Kineosporia babensis]|uniref:Acyl-CoA dehydrogenase family protein n=1 Tax=Kineosporia babensis TaxID=499548 RepID=A0A9X1NJ06_9ACTN|nr:acyl-CoA dehydrogenase family protein [Kineosporia babensis]MCD5314985.1 acyl-CoA dehydrogenase family protein [Kineosporia babensis]
MGSQILEDVRALAPLIRAQSDQAEADGLIGPDVIEKLNDLGIFRLALPAEFGGRATDPREMILVFEELGRADGSVGWCAMIGAITGMSLTYLPPRTASDLMQDERLMIAGVGAPNGEAQTVDGGYRLTGRWSMASGSRHSNWLVAGARTPEGMRVMLLRAQDVTVHPTWNALGLRATSSHDFSVSDVFVPSDRVFDVGAEVRSPGSLSGFPLTVLSFGVAAVALGIARAAIEEFTDLARRKGPNARLATAAAEATALHRSGLAFLLDVYAEPARDAVGSAAQQLAAVSAARSAAQAVDLVYAAAGTAAVHASGPLQRYLRDVHTAAQHGMVSANVLEQAGNTLLEPA